jgi:hypothetical protein
MMCLIQCAHHDLGVDAAVVRHERADLIQPRVEVPGVIFPRQHEFTEAFERRGAHNVADEMIGG